MLTIKNWALIAGILLCALGVECLPSGLGANPKRDLSLFQNYADLGAFTGTGVLLIGAGVLVILMTVLFPWIVRGLRVLSIAVRSLFALALVFGGSSVNGGVSESIIYAGRLV